MAPGTAPQASLEPPRWRLRLPRAALAVAEPTLVRSGVAPRALWQLPGRRQWALTLRVAPGPGRLPALPGCPGRTWPWGLSQGSGGSRPARPGS